MSKNFVIKTFGCQMNEYDSNRIADLLSTIDYKRIEEVEKADCFIFNTCHIREKATQKVYSDIGKIKKILRGKQSKPLFVLAGCVATHPANTNNGFDCLPLKIFFILPISE